MSDLRSLYQEVILDHNRSPRNSGKLAEANREANGFNPLCGDKIHLYLKVNDGKVDEVAFEGSGCAISTASASMMTEAVKGKTLQEAEDLFAGFHQLVTDDSATENNVDRLGKLAVFGGVREFPTRVKCATLAWHTLKAAFDNQKLLATTE